MVVTKVYKGDVEICSIYKGNTLVFEMCGLATPTGIGISQKKNNPNVVVVWTDSISLGATHVKIRRNGTVIGTVAVGVETYSDTSWLSGFLYTYTLQAWNASTESTGEVLGVNKATFTPD